MFNFVIKNIGSISYNPQNRLFIITNETPKFDLETANKIIEIYNEFVGQNPTIVIFNNITPCSFVFNLNTFLKSFFDKYNILAFIVVNDRALSKAAVNVLALFNLTKKIKFKSAKQLEDAVTWGEKQVKLFEQKLCKDNVKSKN